MDIDANALLASLLVSVVGTATFVYGKRQSRVAAMAVGVGMVVYPYFVESVVAIVAIALALLVALWAAARLGW